MNVRLAKGLEEKQQDKLAQSRDFPLISIMQIHVGYRLACLTMSLSHFGINLAIIAVMK
jgi:hypothetical protein